MDGRARAEWKSCRRAAERATSSRPVRKAAHVVDPQLSGFIISCFVSPFPPHNAGKYAGIYACKCDGICANTEERRCREPSVCHFLLLSTRKLHRS